MALSLLHHHPLLLILPFLLVSSTTTTTTSASHHHHHHEGLKSLHFTLYQQETANKTAHTIVKGVAVPGVSQTASPFGTLAAFQDPMTLTPNITSKIVAMAQGTTVTCALDGLEDMSIGKITLNLKHYKGSISIVGVTNFIKPSDYPVLGGTGDFLFVQGYLRSSPVNLVGITSTYKIQFHLYWPPYATHKSS